MTERKTRERGFQVKETGLELIEQKMREQNIGSYEQLADQSRLSVDTVKRIFNRQWGKNPQKNTVQAIARVLNLDPSDLVEGWHKVPQPKKSVPPQDIDWREICTNLLDEEAQRRQATGYGIGHEVDIYVPLGLVKPKQQPRRSGENPDSTQGMQQYQLQGENEIEKRYAYQDFLDRVIAKADKNLAIIGEPGAGKSTWLQQIVQYLRGIPPTPLTEGGLWLGFPIWIPLANLGDFTLEEYLLNRWLKDAFSLLEPTTAQKQALVALFNSGKVWLLLDGVDEMKTANPGK